jgi:hypothetical protein
MREDLNVKNEQFDFLYASLKVYLESEGQLALETNRPPHFFSTPTHLNNGAG